MKHRSFPLFAALFATLVGTTTPGAACLTPVAPIEAEVVDLGANPGGLAQAEVRVSGFELAGPYPYGCTLGLGLESQILGPPTWAIQKRAVTRGLVIVDPAAGTDHHDFFSNPAATLDLNGVAIGQGFFSWPMPVWLQPFTTDDNTALNGSLPTGEVVLVFDVLVKPGFDVQDLASDLAAFGHVAADFSYTDFASGTTYMFWSWPFLTPIDSVTP